MSLHIKFKTFAWNLLICRCSSSTCQSYSCAYTWTVQLIFHFHLGLQAVYWRKTVFPRISIISWQIEVTESSKQFWVQATCEATHSMQYTFDSEIQSLEIKQNCQKSLPHFSYVLYQVLLAVLLSLSNFILLKILPLPQNDNEKDSAACTCLILEHLQHPATSTLYLWLYETVKAI